MNSIKLYAIRHIPTGHLLPCANGRLNRGGSHVEPCDPNVMLPRLMSDARTAKIVLSHWLKGKVFASRGKDREGEYFEDIFVKPQSHRRREEMEVIAVEVHLPSRDPANSL